MDIAIELEKGQEAIEYLWHTGWADGKARLQVAEQAAQSAGVKFRSRGIGDATEVSDVLAAVKKSGAMAVIIQPTPFTYQQRDRIIESDL